MYEGTFYANTENTNPACLYDRLSILHRKESLIMRQFQKQTLDRENSQSGIQNSHEEALLDQLLSELQLENRISPGKKQRYRRVLLRQYVVKHAARLACLVFAAALLAPGTVVPASVSEVSAAPASDASSVQVSFRVDGLIPVREITAQINEHSLSVESSSYQNYQITVEENGYLLLDIYSATGLHSSHSMEISGIDEEAPVVTSHQLEDGELILWISDGDGVGIDYDSITAQLEGSGAKTAPSRIDASIGCVAFPAPQQAMLITIADKNGNYRVLSFTPM